MAVCKKCGKDSKFEMDENSVTRLMASLAAMEIRYYFAGKNDKKNAEASLKLLLEIIADAYPSKKKQETTSYTLPVMFGPKNERHDDGHHDEVYTVKEFLNACECHALIDYDGYGHPVKNKMADKSVYIMPSNTSLIPKDATHIVWYNR
jgi:hypothetical protein